MYQTRKRKNTKEKGKIEKMTEKEIKKQSHIFCQDNSSVIGKVSNRGIHYQCKPFIRIKNTTTGITLVALVVTIVVLLILASITIGAIVRKNGINKIAKEAVIETEIQKVEEAANIIYAGLIIRQEVSFKDYQGEDLIVEVIEKLRKQGYTIKVAGNTTGNVEAIEIENIQIVPKDEMEIEVNLKKTLEQAKASKELSLRSVTQKVTNYYYVLLSDGYHKISTIEDRIEVEKQVFEEIDLIEPEDKLEVKILEGTDLITIKEVNQTTITIQSGEGVGTAKIAVTCGNVTKTFEVVVKQDISIGDFISYNITYKDICKRQMFTADNGWRILDAGQRNENGSRNGVKLVSTGIVAKMYYSKSQSARSWWGSSGTNVVRHTNGLKNNFTQIRMVNGDISAPSDGCYLQIGKYASGTLGADAFVTPETEKVSCLTLEEINKARGLPENSAAVLSQNEPAVGLFCIDDLTQLGIVSSRI